MGHCMVQSKALNENDDGDKKKNNVYLKRERERWVGKLLPAFCQCDGETHAICSDRLHKHTHTSVKAKQFSTDGKPKTNGSKQ